MLPGKLMPRIRILHPFLSGQWAGGSFLHRHEISCPISVDIGVIRVLPPPKWRDRDCGWEYDTHSRYGAYSADFRPIWSYGSPNGQIWPKSRKYQITVNKYLFCYFFSDFAHNPSRTIYYQNLCYVSVRGPLGGHFQHTGARFRLIEAKNETSEN